MKNGIIINSFGIKTYYLNDKKHREDGPAVEYLGNEHWYYNGQVHRIDGPAVNYPDGTCEWYYKDQKIECSSQQEFEKIIKLKAFW